MIKTLTNLFKQDKEKFVVPKGVQDVIPVAAIFDDGIFKVGKDKYSKTYRFTDINYAVASREDLLRLGGRRYNRPRWYRREMREWHSLYRRGQLRRCLQAKTVRSRKQQYLWIRYSGILKIPDGVWKIEKMAAQLSSHRVHYEKSVVSLLFRKIWCV